MALHLIHGPPNSGKAGLVRRRLLAVLGEDPVLVVPTEDDRQEFERELSAGGAVLGATVTTFGGLFAIVAAATGVATPPLTPAQRQGAIDAAVMDRERHLGPLRRSARRPGFPRALERLLDELQGAGLEPADVQGTAATLEGLAYLGDLASLFAAYATIRDGLGRTDSHGVARAAIGALQNGDGDWTRPVFLYGFDDLTTNQLDLIAALSASAEITVSLPHEEGNTALAARNEPAERLDALGPTSVETTAADPGNTASPLLFALERGFGGMAPGGAEPDGSLVILRSAGARGEAEAIAAEAARLIATGTAAEQIAIVVRDPARRGPLIDSTLAACGIHAALDAEVPVGGTAVGGALVALLEAELGRGRAADLLRYLRGPSGASPRNLDWFERELRRERVQSAAAALRIWKQRDGALPDDLVAIRAAKKDPGALATAVGGVAEAMSGRLQRQAESLPRSNGTMARSSTVALELRAAGAVTTALRERASLPGLAPRPAALARIVADLRVRAWSGAPTGRVRIAGPDRFRAQRFDHVFAASLQDGEFPRRDSGTDPFLSESQRRRLGLPPRRESEAEDRYFFHACLALPRRRLHLSYRDSDENGAAEARSPFLDEVRRLLAPPPPTPGEPDLLELSLTRTRDLAQVVQKPGDAPSENELARALAARGSGEDAGPGLARADAAPAVAGRIAARLEAARETDRRTRAPGPITNAVVLERLASVDAYGGTTLEGFDVCSYRWFVSHELRPERLEPTPDPLTQGTIAHEALRRLYAEKPADDPLPRPDSLAAWLSRAHYLVGKISAERGLGEHPAERAILRRVEGLLTRFLREEAEREEAGFLPWLLEAEFGGGEGTEHGVMEIDGWGLHGAIDRVDRDSEGRALVIDYKLSSAVTAQKKLEEEAKLQLQLYLITVAELWGAEAVGGLYYPLRASSQRRPRGIVLDEAAEALAPYGLSRTDLVDADEFAAALAEARHRAGGIVARMRRGEIDRDPGPRRGLRGHGICPEFCDLAPICRRDRAPVDPDEEPEDQ